MRNRVENRKAGLVIITLTALTLSVSADFADEIIRPAVIAICGLFKAFVVITGALASLVFIYAGIKWLSSESDPATRKNAKGMIKHAIVGLCIIIISDVIVGVLTAGAMGTCSITGSFMGSGARGSCGTHPELALLEDCPGECRLVCLRDEDHEGSGDGCCVAKYGARAPLCCAPD